MRRHFVFNLNALKASAMSRRPAIIWEVVGRTFPISASLPPESRSDPKAAIGCLLRLLGTVVCTENLVGIDLMKESLNVGQDGRADISLREVRSQTTFSGTHGPLPFSLGSCSCRHCSRSAGPNGGGRQDLTFHHSLRSDSPI